MERSMKHLRMILGAAALIGTVMAAPLAIAQETFSPSVVYQDGAAPAVHDAAAYQAAADAPALGDSNLGDGNAELAWGDMVLLALQVLGGLIVTAIVSAAGVVYMRAKGEELNARDAANLRAFTESAYNFAVNAVAPAMRGKKLTVKDAGPVVEWMLHYGQQLYPGLIEKFDGKEAQRMRAWSVVDLAEGEAIPLALPFAQAAAAAPVGGDIAQSSTRPSP